MPKFGSVSHGEDVRSLRPPPAFCPFTDQIRCFPFSSISVRGEEMRAKGRKLRQCDGKEGLPDVGMSVQGKRPLPNRLYTVAEVLYLEQKTEGVPGVSSTGCFLRPPEVRPSLFSALQVRPTSSGGQGVYVAMLLGILLLPFLSSYYAPVISTYLAFSIAKEEGAPPDTSPFLLGI